MPAAARCFVPRCRGGDCCQRLVFNVLGSKKLNMDAVLLGAVLDRQGQHQLEREAEDPLLATRTVNRELALAIERLASFGAFGDAS